MNRKVLIVDDHAEVRESLARLMRTDYEVDVASSSDEALQKLRDSGPFAVILSDHQMPDGDGVSLLERAREESPDTVRILMTVQADLELAREAKDRGEVFRFLQKPLPQEVLRTALDESLEHYEQEESERELLSALAEARASAQGLTRELEQPSTRARDVFGAISGLAEHVANARSLEGLARIVLEQGAELLPGRGLRLDLFTGRTSEGSVTSTSGPSPRAPLHREVLKGAEGEVGTLVVGSHDGNTLSGTDRQVVHVLASITCVAAQDQIHRRQRDDAQHAVTFAMARLAVIRDNETGQHLERVSRYCAMAAENLRQRRAFAATVTDAFIEDIIRSAPLHDIGKVGIPDAILLKPDRLDPDEWEVMRTHAQIGADILTSVIAHTNDQSYLRMAHDIASCHHEKWDGSGYPRGLSGRAIPLCARILSVVDCFDALTSRRPYKDPWPIDKAFAYVRAHSGTQFDPDVVEAFLERESDVHDICLRLADPEV